MASIIYGTVIATSDTHFVVLDDNDNTHYLMGGQDVLVPQQTLRVEYQEGMQHPASASYYGWTESLTLMDAHAWHEHMQTLAPHEDQVIEENDEYEFEDSAMRWSA